MLRAFALILVVRISTLVLAGFVVSAFPQPTNPVCFEKKHGPTIEAPPPREEFFHVRGGRVGEEAPTIRSVRRVEVEPRERSSSQSDSRYRLALHDGEGRELQSVPVRLWSVCVEPTNPLDAGPTLYNFGAELLASPNSRRVVLMEGGRELDSVDASSTPPTLVRALPRPGVYDRAALEIAWHVHDPDPGATVRVDVLGDIGHAVGFEARGKRVWRYLRPKGTFEMVATDGFWTTRVTRTFAFLPGGRVRIE